MGLARKLLNTALNPVGLEVAGRGETDRAAKLSAERDELSAQLQTERTRPKAAPPPDLVDEIASVEDMKGEEKSQKILAMLTFANINPHVIYPLFSKDASRRLEINPLYRAMLGAAEYGRGNLTIADAHFENALSRSTEPAYFHAAALCATVSGDEDRCANILNHGIAVAPQERRLVVELAACRFRTGNIEAAQRILEPVKSLFDPAREQAGQLAAELRQAQATNAMERIYGGDLYNDSFVEQLWWSYHEAFCTLTAWQDGTSLIGDLVRKRVSELQRNVNAPAIIDFGVMTAFPNLQLARMFPKARHYGVDRQTLIKTMNERFYGAHNLSFVDGDIFDFLQHEAPPGSILVHARTATVCYPAFLHELYRKCAERKIGHIIAIEFAGLSKDTMLFQDFAAEQSVASRSNMFFHPYRKMLAEVGYEAGQELNFSKQFGIGADYGNGESVICLTASLRS